MSDRVPPPAPSQEALEDVVDDLLGHIDDAIHPPSVHSLGPRHELPPEDEVDPLEELSVELRIGDLAGTPAPAPEDLPPASEPAPVSEPAAIVRDAVEPDRVEPEPQAMEPAAVQPQALEPAAVAPEPVEPALAMDRKDASEPAISMALVDDDSEEITQQWSPRTLLDEDTFDEDAGTLRPSSISFAPKPAAQLAGGGPAGGVARSLASLLPWRVGTRWRWDAPQRALALIAAVTVIAAAVAYRFGPHASGAPVTAAASLVEQVELGRYEPSAPRARPGKPAGATEQTPASPTARRIMFNIKPANAFLSLRKLDETHERRSGGPWPHALDLEPGEYELVAFRAGYRPLVRRITVDMTTTPDAMELALHVEDIYE